MSLESYLRAAPKGELHVHLEGAIAPETVLTLARRNRVDLPADDVAGLREWFRFRDFEHFIEVYVAITCCLRTADDYELIGYALGAAMARQHIRYAEITFTPGTHHFLGVSLETYFDGLQRGRARALADFGVEMRWVFDIVRNVADPDRLWAAADYTTSVAIECRDEGVVALGLGGLERGYPAEPFAPYFDRARAAGLRSAPHAGELAGPESIWGAIRALGAERVGHGVRAIEDPALVAYLADRQIPLEVSPWSNLRLAIYPNMDAHPLRRLVAAGIPLTVNSDDPALFNADLSDNLALLLDPPGYDVETLDTLLLNGVRHSFLPHAERTSLEVSLASELDELKRWHGIAL
jgi:aminodeoxyfutalosine deaminase